MLPRDAGYSGRVVADPVELRAGATRFEDAASELQSLSGRVGCRRLPELPPEIVGRVQSELTSVSTLLASASTPYTNDAKELRVRALWAEISAAGGTVDGLSADQLRQFREWMADGTMLDYATPDQRRTAGFLVGQMYQGNYKDPEKLLELAAIMRANGSDAQFAGAFIDEFGASRFADIPRVLQAMEWGEAMTMSGGTLSDPMVDDDLARQFWMDGYRYEGDTGALLEGFSMALAAATTTPGALSRTTQRELAYDEDAWAVAQLLQEGTFGPEFLRDVFHNGVIAQIGKEGGNANWGQQDYTRWPLGSNTDDPLSVDQKQIIMDALERNPEAIALAFSDPVPEEFQFGVLQGEDDPIKILYDHMPPADDDAAEQFARMYTSGVDWANEAGELEQAYGMTESMIDRTLNSDYGPKDPLTEALAQDLADHHMENIHLSSTASFSGGPQWIDIDGGGSEYENAYRLMFEKGDLTDLLREFSDDDEMNETILAGARDYQAELILDNTREPAGDSVVWAKQIGGFDGVLMNANDLENIEDFDADNARHKAVFSFLSSVTGAVQSLNPAGAAAGVVTGPVLSYFEGATGPSVEELLSLNDGAREALTNQMHAGIVAGYHENGLLDGEAAPPAAGLDSGRLIDLRGDVTPEQVNQLLSWMENNRAVGDVVGDVFREADQARDNRDIDTGG